MKRYKYCSLSKYHQGPCHFEWMTWPKSEVEPRCLRRSQPISEFEIHEPSFVRKVHVPVVVDKPRDQGPTVKAPKGEFSLIKDPSVVVGPEAPGGVTRAAINDAIKRQLGFGIPVRADERVPPDKLVFLDRGVPVGVMTLKGDEAEFRRIRDTYRSSATFAQDLYRNRRSPVNFMPPFHERHWDQHRNACEMRIVRDEEGTRFVPGRPIFKWPGPDVFRTPDVKAAWPKIDHGFVDADSMKRFRFPGGIHKVEHGPEYRQEVPDSFPREPTPEFQKEADVPTPMKHPKLDSFGLVLILALMLLPGCQGWLHGAELGLHGPDPRIERAVRSSHKVVLDVLEQDFEAVEQANVTDPVTGKVTRENLEKQFRLMRFKALQIETIDKLLRAIAEYNGVDLEGKAGEARSEAGERAKQLRDLLEDVAKEQGKDMADELLDGLR